MRFQIARSLALAAAGVMSSSSALVAAQSMCGSTWTQSLSTPLQFSQIIAYPNQPSFLLASFITSDPSGVGTGTATSFTSSSSASSAFPSTEIVTHVQVGTTTVSAYDSCGNFNADKYGVDQEGNASGPDASQSLLSMAVDRQGNVAVAFNVPPADPTQSPLTRVLYYPAGGPGTGQPSWTKVLPAYSPFSLAFGPDGQLITFGLPVAPATGLPTLMLLTPDTGALAWSETSYAGTPECATDNTHISIYVPPTSPPLFTPGSVYTYAQCGSAIFGIAGDGSTVYTVVPPPQIPRPIAWYNAPAFQSISSRYAFVMEGGGANVYETTSGNWVSSIAGQLGGGSFAKLQSIYVILGLPSSSPISNGTTLSPSDGTMPQSSQGLDAVGGDSSQLLLSVAPQTFAPQIDVDTDTDKAILIFQSSASFQISLFSVSNLVTRYTAVENSASTTPAPQWTVQLNMTLSSYSNPVANGELLYFSFQSMSADLLAPSNTMVLVIDLLSGAIVQSLALAPQTASGEVGGQCSMISPNSVQMSTTASAITSASFGMNAGAASGPANAAAVTNEIRVEEFMLYFVCNSMEIVGITYDDSHWQSGNFPSQPLITTSSTGTVQTMLFNSVANGVAASGQAGLLAANGATILDASNLLVVGTSSSASNTATTSTATAAPANIASSSSALASPPLIQSTGTNIGILVVPRGDNNGDYNGEDDSVGWALALSLVLVFLGLILACLLYSCFFGRSSPRAIGRSAPSPSGAPNFAPAVLVDPSGGGRAAGPGEGNAAVSEFDVKSGGIARPQALADRKRLVKEDRGGRLGLFGAGVGGGEGGAPPQSAASAMRRPSMIGLTEGGRGDSGMVDVELGQVEADDNGTESRRSSISAQPYAFKRFQDQV